MVCPTYLCTTRAQALFDLRQGKFGSPRSALSAKIGAVLLQRNLRVGDIIREWDEDNSGTIDPDEWHMHLRRLGVGMARKESDDLFAQLDPDGDGELTMEEMRKVLKKLSEMAIKAAAEEKAAAKLVGERKREAAAAQAQAQQEQLSLSSESFKRGPLTC